LIGLYLPGHSDYGENSYSKDTIPSRLVDNLTSGYAKLYDWTTSEKNMKERIEDAFNARTNRKEKIDNPREQFNRNRS
jgi:hypothetical protein